MKYFEYSSRASLRDIFITLGNAVEGELLTKAKKASCYSLLLDDTTDVSTTEQMICYIQFWDIYDIQTSFLFIENVFANATSANADALYNLVKSKLDQLGLDYSKLSGLSTDGASVMVGKRGGLVAKIKRDRPSLLAIHCICHRLALACTDTNVHDLLYMKDVESYVTQIWKTFHFSPLKLAALLAAQTEIHKMALSDTSKKMLTKTMKRAGQTRWLSFESAIQSLFQEFVTVVQTLNKFSNDATCYGLMKKITSVKFISAMYILEKILPILADLSRHFQKGSINFSMIVPAIDSTKFKLTAVSAEEISSKINEDFSST
ncbi:unnamed protein product [Mytilus coruscus]|uniref:Uncharacterized protein n=1 Tax=Mytilus coruscus TaxID=42192 RepID=A0A6J8BH22_MYTCO|nr:unnamed protein product [Mytilus coruscus]